ncbi:MAG TPA: PhnD/SsuA/transferrin family substrate-binding protein, partial [Roseiflexaceae bacterium]|nr:PhnD/SsuA/transferrin family substrate-binding protein [Roseiflexaceae bacterium]
MAANADATYRAIAGELARRTGLSVTCLDDLPWQDRQRVLEDGQADVGAICGAVYVCLVGKPTARVQLLAAPVMRGARYHGRPVYFSDLVMRADANIETFADLRGTRLGYNEPRSYSGYLVLRAHLAAIGEER